MLDQRFFLQLAQELGRSLDDEEILKEAEDRGDNGQDQRDDHKCLSGSGIASGIQVGKVNRCHRQDQTAA